MMVAFVVDWSWGRDKRPRGMELAPALCSLLANMQRCLGIPTSEGTAQQCPESLFPDPATFAFVCGWPVLHR